MASAIIHSTGQFVIRHRSKHSKIVRMYLTKKEAVELAWQIIKLAAGIK